MRPPTRPMSGVRLQSTPRSSVKLEKSSCTTRFTTSSVIGVATSGSSSPALVLLHTRCASVCASEVVMGRADNPVVATITVPKLVSEEEEAAAAAATPSAADVPATAQAAPDKAAEGDAKGGDKKDKK